MHESEHVLQVRRGIKLLLNLRLEKVVSDFGTLFRTRIVPHRQAKQDSLPLPYPSQIPQTLQYCLIVSFNDSHPSNIMEHSMCSVTTYISINSPVQHLHVLNWPGDETLSSANTGIPLWLAERPASSYCERCWQVAALLSQRWAPFAGPPA